MYNTVKIQTYVRISTKKEGEKEIFFPMTTEAPDRMAADHAFANSFPLQRQGMILYRENFENWIIAGISESFAVRTAPSIWQELRTKAEGSGSCVHGAA